MTDGWCPFADRVEMVPERCGTTNVGAGQMWPQVIVDHVMDGHYAGALTMMQDRTVGDDADDYASWHFSIAKDGRVAQHASIWTPTWAAGLRSTNRTEEPISTFRARWGTNPNDWCVHIEHEDNRIRPATFTEAQIEASIRVHRWVWNQCEWLLQLPRGGWTNPDVAESRFAFHSQMDATPPSRAHDPGPNFPWDRIVNATLHREAAPEPIPLPVEPPVSANRYRLEALDAVQAATNAAFDALRKEWSA